MIGIPQVRVLTTDARSQRRKLGVNERADQRDQSAHQPGSENERRWVDISGDDCWIYKNSRADNAAHHDHGGIEQTKPPGQRNVTWLLTVGRRLTWLW